MRLVADWLTRGSVTGDEPELTGLPVVDALVAAAVAQRARSLGIEGPAWTRRPERCLPSFWHPGLDKFFAYSLAHAPAEFFVRGLIVERDSLVSV